jgi:hypothetical protein
VVNPGATAPFSSPRGHTCTRLQPHGRALGAPASYRDPRNNVCPGNKCYTSHHPAGPWARFRRSLYYGACRAWRPRAVATNKQQRAKLSRVSLTLLRSRGARARANSSLGRTRAIASARARWLLTTKLAAAAARCENTERTALSTSLQGRASALLAGEARRCRSSSAG